MTFPLVYPQYSPHYFITPIPLQDLLFLHSLRLHSVKHLCLSFNCVINFMYITLYIKQHSLSITFFSLHPYLGSKFSFLFQKNLHSIMSTRESSHKDILNPDVELLTARGIIAIFLQRIKEDFSDSRKIDQVSVILLASPPFTLVQITPSSSPPPLNTPHLPSKSSTKPELHFWNWNLSLNF